MSKLLLLAPRLGPVIVLCFFAFNSRGQQAVADRSSAAVTPRSMALYAVEEIPGKGYGCAEPAVPAALLSAPRKQDVVG